MQKKVLLYCFMFLSMAAFAVPQVDVIVHGARIYTCQSQPSIASVMVIHAGKFVAVGNQSLLKKYKAKKYIDAQGNCIYPGFIDAHCHFTGYAFDRYKLNLFAVTSYAQMLDKIQQYASHQTNFWIEGRMWNEQWWKVLPASLHNQSLNELFPNRPVFLLRSDGHTALCNAYALQLAGITIQTKIDGGFIGVQDGQLTGIIKDNAIDYVKKHIPILHDTMALQYLHETQADFFSEGVTTVVDCMVENKWQYWLQQAYALKQLQIRNFYFLTASSENLSLLQSPPDATNLLCAIAGLKIFADGTLGSRSACLLSPYHDESTGQGYLTTSLSLIDTLVRQMAQTRYQVAVHAIGDSAVRAILQTYARYLSPHNQRRWRIEHAQVIHPNDLHFFRHYQIVPSVQPTHAMSDQPMASDRLGSHRLQHAYAYKLLWQQNHWLPLGTDFPVEAINPFRTFTAAVFRKSHVKAKAFQSAQSLTRMQALLGITRWAAQSVHKEKYIGSIEPGKEADFVITSTDLLHDSFEKIHNAKIIATYVHGQLVYTKKKVYP